jgi:hypothetical protein
MLPRNGGFIESNAEYPSIYGAKLRCIELLKPLCGARA